MRRDRPCECLALGDRNGRRCHRERASGRSAAEDLGDGKIWSEAAARRPALSPAGEIFSPDRLGAVPAGSSAQRDMQGRFCGNPIEVTAWLIRRSTCPRPRSARDRPLQSSRGQAARHPGSTRDDDARIHRCRPALRVRCRRVSVAQRGEACREIIGDTVRTGWLLSEIARNTVSSRGLGKRFYRCILFKNIRACCSSGVNVWGTRDAEPGLAVRTVKRFPHIHIGRSQCYF
jgi:hypothetical protein